MVKEPASSQTGPVTKATGKTTSSMVLALKNGLTDLSIKENTKME